MEQVHEHFKVFAVPAEGGLASACLAAEKILTQEKIPARSMSLLHRGEDILFTFGWDEDGGDVHKVQIVCAWIGTVTTSAERLQDALESHSDGEEVICHSIFQIPGQEGALHAALMKLAH